MMIRSPDQRQVSVVGAQGRLLDLHQELDVVAGLLQLVEQQLQRLLRLERGEHPAQLDDDGELVGRHEDLLLARARRVDVDGREDPLVRQAAVQLDLDRKSTRLNSSHANISYAVFCLKK